MLATTTRTQLLQLLLQAPTAGLRRWVQTGVADELVIQIYRLDLASYLPQLSKPEVLEARDRIPTAIAVLSGQRNRPTPLPLIQEKVDANRQQGLGTGFFYLESLWSLGPEQPAERIRGLQQLLPPQSAPMPALQPAARPALPPLPPPPLEPITP